MRWSVKMRNEKFDDMRKILSASWSWQEFNEFISAYSDNYEKHQMIMSKVSKLTLQYSQKLRVKPLNGSRMKWKFPGVVSPDVNSLIQLWPCLMKFQTSANVRRTFEQTSPRSVLSLVFQASMEQWKLAELLPSIPHAFSISESPQPFLLLI